MMLPCGKRSATEEVAAASTTADTLAVESRSSRASEELLVRVFQQTRDELLGTLYHVLGNPEDAQDTLQVAFLNCWEARAELASVRNVRSWVWRVTLNAAKDLLRNAWRRRAKPLNSAPPCACPQASPPDALLKREKLERLRAALLGLRSREKEVFLLRQAGELTFEEIARLHNSPVGTVKTQMRNAVHKLRRVLREAEASTLASVSAP